MINEIKKWAESKTSPKEDIEEYWKDGATPLIYLIFGLMAVFLMVKFTQTVIVVILFIALFLITVIVGSTLLQILVIELPVRLGKWINHFK